MQSFDQGGGYGWGCWSGLGGLILGLVTLEFIGLSIDSAWLIPVGFGWTLLIYFMTDKLIALIAWLLTGRGIH